MPNGFNEQTREQRLAYLERATVVRRERAAFKQDLKDGKISAVEALDHPVAQRMHVRDVLCALPGIGKTTAARVMCAVRIAPKRTISGLTERQRTALEAYLASEFGGAE